MKTIFLLFIVPLFLFGTSKKNENRNAIPDTDCSVTRISTEVIAALPDVSIANGGTVEGNGGQRSVEVIVGLSQFAASPVTVAYRTRDRTATAGSDYVATNGSVTFAKGEMVKRITISVNGDVAIEANETCEIVLSNVSGATLADSIGTVTIVNDDFTGGGNPIYEVRFTYTGYTTLFGGPPDCPVRTNGRVILTGLLSGAENVNSDDDILYTGDLLLDVDMDICSVKPGNPDKFCSITVIGFSQMKTELEIQYDQRGGYIKFEEVPNSSLSMMFGSCDPEQINEERPMFPNKTIATVFNGLDLPMLTHRTLQVGRYVERDGSNETVVEVLRVVRR